MNLDDFLKSIEGQGETLRKIKEENKRKKKKGLNYATKELLRLAKKKGLISSKDYETGEIMKASSELKKKGDKYTVDTELDIKKGLDDKIKKAFIKSIIMELNKNFDDYDFFMKRKIDF